MSKQKLTKKESKRIDYLIDQLNDNALTLRIETAKLNRAILVEELKQGLI